MDLELVRLAVPALAKGLWQTAILTLISIAIGFNLGLALAVMRLSKNSVLSRFAKGYSTVFRGTPLLVQLFLFYYGLGQLSFVRDNPVLWWIVGDGAHCAVMALALNTAAYTSEILRGGLMSIPGGLVEAAQACGMSRLLCFRRITFPLAIRLA
ncbi:ABC transporter permease subunit, partial [Ensifer sp. SSB1]|uniref:ABC transporter permease subunit n=1 Tax=Ensifer sp. SSB1 TaxID=2795385 RepID=UPI001A36636E